MMGQRSKRLVRGYYNGQIDKGIQSRCQRIGLAGEDSFSTSAHWQVGAWNDTTTRGRCTFYDEMKIEETTT
jgi:hypothetical protein